MFSVLPEVHFNFSVTTILPSANALNLDKSKVLLFGKELTKQCQGLSTMRRDPNYKKSIACECQSSAVGCLIEDKKSKSKNEHNFEIVSLDCTDYALDNEHVHRVSSKYLQ